MVVGDAERFSVNLARVRSTTDKPEHRLMNNADVCGRKRSTSEGKKVETETRPYRSC
jgi:hypothetical protein